MLRLRVLRVCVCVCECVWLRLLTKSRMRLGLEAWAWRECVCLALSKFHFANKAPKWASEFAPLKSAHKSQQQDEQGPASAPAPVPGLGLGLGQDHISEYVCQLFMPVYVCVCVVDVLVLLRCCLPAFIWSADCDIVTTITSGSDAHINAHTPPKHAHTHTYTHTL